MKRKYSFSEIVKFSGSTCKPFDGKKEYISTGCIHENSISNQEVETVDYKTKPSRANLQVETGDIIFAKMQGTKKTLQIDNELSEKIFSTGFCAVKPKDGVITTKCLYYLLSSSLFLKEKDKNCSGATQKAINGSGFKNIKLNVPDFSLQKNIEKQLDNLTMAIEDKKMEIQRLDNLIKARFVEMFGDPVLNPLKWEKSALGDNATLLNGRAYRQDELLDSGKYPVLRVGNFFSNREWYYSDLELKKDKYCDNGDLLYAWSASFGPRIWYGGKAIYHYHIWKILVGNAYDKFFLCKLLEYATESLMGGTHGIAMMHLTKSEMEKTEFIVPPLACQRQFADFVSQVDKSKFVLQKSLEKTQLLFDSLMWEYFGQ